MEIINFVKIRFIGLRTKHQELSHRHLDRRKLRQMGGKYRERRKNQLITIFKKHSVDTVV